ncbi:MULTISPECIES: spermine synthase [unclassified Paenibacillus]|uniref:spermine synthase n=1 Tax=unclassified Paenibacillus TaxID=185978 RepID=UPI001AE85524|nr:MULTISPECIES: spermine synthase [unclassified Paenibacillus]MBP1156945.1 hypothetical protein [Paenibacillus sp. PvP091]MBP1172316.1 hypothetical protein [Paenibacillus sp. PvR098]MBP2438697.1 hypothetical protein [Paenibacillus sp. PvP052]
MKAAGRSDLFKDGFITFVTAFSMITYEIVLSRFFAVIMDYNYVFLVISLCTLGIGIGGYISFRWPLIVRKIQEYVLGLYSLFLAGSTILMYALSFKGILFYSACSFIPFLVGGTMVSSLIQKRQEQAGFMYFTDLAGAGIGAALVIPLMNVLNPIQTISLISFLLFSVYCFVRFDQMKSFSKTVHVLLLLALTYNLFSPLFERIPFNAYLTSPHNVFVEEKEAKIVFSSWDAFARTDVYDADDDDLLYITIDGGAVSPISKYSGEAGQVDYLRSTTGFLAFQDIPRDKVLLIGAGGGQEVLAARMLDYRRIEAVDINKGSFEAVSRLSGFSGDVFGLSGVSPIVSDGRNYIRETKSTYDLIYLSLVKKNEESRLGLSLSENYMFTREAVADYIDKLNSGGRLGILLHNEMELYKVLYAAVSYFRKAGVPEAEIGQHIAVVGTYQHLGHVVEGMDGHRITRPLLLVNKQPFTPSNAASLLSSIRGIQQIPIHIPYVHDRFEAMGEWMNQAELNLEANTDDKPFFYSKGQGISPLLPALLISVVGLAALMARRAKLSMGTTVYFSGIALGFMMIEVTLIQHLILPLGHPTLSFVIVLGTLLITGGIGSYCSERWSMNGSKRYLPLLLIGILALGVQITIRWFEASQVMVTPGLRILGAILLLMPLGFFMGMPFPYGLKRMVKEQVALSWAINGLMTVAGSLLAAMVSYGLGFSATMTAAAGIYVLLYMGSRSIITT